MARRRKKSTTKRRRSTTKRRRTTPTRRRSSPRRKTTKKRRTRRRKRNPSLPVKDLALGAAAGATMAAADFGLRGVPQLDRMKVGLIELGLGLLVGGIAAGFNKSIGVGLAAGGVATGGAHLASQLIEKTPSAEVGAIRARVGRHRVQLAGAQQQAPALNAVRVQTRPGARKHVLI